jgi:DNA-binding NarL/FixJ family response regulator
VANPMLSVLLVDDDPLVRAGLKTILSAADDLRVVGEAGDGAEAIAAVAEHRPDVVLMDVRMPGLNGIDATTRITVLRNPPQVIVLTTFHLDEYVFGALRAGASGFLLKDTPPTDIIRAVRLVAAGEAMLSPSVTRTLIERFGADPTAPRRTAAKKAVRGLSEREREVAAEVAQGRSNAEIAARLYMSEATVKSHVSRVMAKLGAANRVQVALTARDAELA